jgi:outer membrane protein assembly factor BamB
MLGRSPLPPASRRWPETLTVSLALAGVGCSSGSSASLRETDAGRRPDSARTVDAARSTDARGHKDGTTSHDASPQDAAVATVPLANGSPWPKFRGNARQTGLGTVTPTTSGGTYFDYLTGRGVFSSPVVAADGTVYVGSADQSYYALNADGSLRWKVATGEIIDSAGLLDDEGRVYFGSGDGLLRACDATTGALLWTFQADAPSTTGAYIDWFEGNVAIGPTGTLYVPNDNFRLYAIDRAKGTADWRFVMPDQTWSLPAVDPTSGTLYVGNNEVLALLGMNTYAISPDGGTVWATSSLGTIAASPLLTADGKIIVGGFDGFVHAYDAASGDSLWSTAARDHIYASAALLPDGTIVVPSADGTLYALDPATGAIQWTFDTPEPIRSSPAVDGAGNIYFGGGDGVLYVLGPTGSLRWSLALIDQPRRNLNASPALGAQAVYLGGESGDVFGVPYEYCLRPTEGTNPACSTTPPFAGIGDGASLLFTESFGGVDVTPPAQIDANQALALSLRVRAQGRTELAILDSTSLQVTVTPAVAVTTALAGNGQFVVITPTSGFTPDASGNVTVAVTGNYLVDMTRSGLAVLPDSGTVGGSVSSSFTFALPPASTMPLPLPVPSSIGQPQGVLELSRLSLPLPTILPSYNQIGFDSLVYLIGFVEGTGTSGTAWMAGAKYPAGQTGPVIDPATGTLLPLSFTYDGGLLTLSNDDGLSVDVLNIVLPLNTFRVSASIDSTGAAAAGGRLTGDAVCAGVPTYGLFLEKLGFCNPQTDLLTVFGGANLGPYGSGTVSAPPGVGTVAFAATAAAVTATLTGSTLVAADHVASVLLIDAVTSSPVSLSYGPITRTTSDASGNLATVTVPLPTTGLPSQVRAYLMVDTYPAAMGTLTLP